MQERKKTLEALISFARPIGQIKASLSALAWDSEEELVSLTCDHLRSVLERYLDGNVNEEEIESWANAIEGRDDIGFEPQKAKILRDILHELANPLLTQRLQPKRAQELVKQVETSSPDGRSQ